MGAHEYCWRDLGKPTIIPKLQMPSIKVISLLHKKTWFSDDFFDGVYENLERISFG
jgi:hypothetical protein